MGRVCCGVVIVVLWKLVVNSFVAVVLCCPSRQICFYLCHRSLNLGRSMLYTSRLPKGLCLSESIASTFDVSTNLSQSYVLVQLSLYI